MDRSRKRSAGVMEGRDQLLQECQTRINYRFTDPELLWEALQPEISCSKRLRSQDNKKMAYVGDAVLTLALRLQSIDRGDCTRSATHLTQPLETNDYLTGIGIAAGIHMFINTDNESDRFYGRHGKSVADVMEAILGAVFRDGGIEATIGVMNTLGLTLPGSQGLLPDHRRISSNGRLRGSIISVRDVDGHLLQDARPVRGPSTGLCTASKGVSLFTTTRIAASANEAVVPPVYAVEQRANTASQSQSLPRAAPLNGVTQIPDPEMAHSMLHSRPAFVPLTNVLTYKASMVADGSDTAVQEDQPSIRPPFDIAGIRSWLLGTNNVPSLRGTKREATKTGISKSLEAQALQSSASAQPVMHRFGLSSFSFPTMSSIWGGREIRSTPSSIPTTDPKTVTVKQANSAKRSQEMRDYRKRESDLDTVKSKLSYFDMRYGGSKTGKNNIDKLRQGVKVLRRVQSGRVEKKSASAGISEPPWAFVRKS